MTYPNIIENQIEQVILHKVRFNIQQKLSRYDLNIKSNVDMYAEHIADGFVYHFKMDILGESRKEKIYCAKNWFQMFKKQHFPKWLLKKFPVQDRELGTLELYQLYPHIKASIPEERHYIHFQKFNYKGLK